MPDRFRNERAEMQLFGELAGVEISYRGRLNFRCIDFRIGDRLPAGFRDQVADGFAFLLQVALKIGAAAAENVDWFVHKTGWLMLSRSYLQFPLCHPERDEGHEQPRALFPLLSSRANARDLAGYHARGCS